MLLLLALAPLPGCGDEPRETASACGAVRLEPMQLGDEGTRRLTLCLIDQERA